MPRVTGFRNFAPLAVVLQEVANLIAHNHRLQLSTPAVFRILSLGTGVLGH